MKRISGWNWFPESSTQTQSTKKGNNNIVTTSQSALKEESTSPNEINQPFSGKKHLKNVRKEKMKRKEEKEEFKCDLCQVSMSDPETMKAHFSGKKHLTNVRKEKMNRKEAECLGVSHDQVMMRLSLMSADPDQQLVELTSLFNMDQEEMGNRVNICKILQRTFVDHYPRCVVYPFGSSLSGLGFPGSDLDIYMDLPVNMTEKQKVLRAMQILSRIPQCSRLQPIINARVPIIKFIHHPSGIHCDIR